MARNVGARVGEGGIEPRGSEALRLWDTAMTLVKQGKIEEARKVPLRTSDRIALERMIQRFDR